MLRVWDAFDYALRSLCQSRRRTALLLDRAPETRTGKLSPHARQYRERLNTKLLLLLKQVWSAHKHVCGPDRAKPFNPPDLSLEEANILRLVGHDLAPYAEVLRDPQDMGGMRMLPGGRSAAQEIERAFKLKPGDFDRVRSLARC